MTIKGLYIRTFCTIISTVLFLTACSRQMGGFTTAELDIINGSDSIMRVLTIENETDLKVLRASCSDLSYEMLTSPAYDKLAELMVTTVTHPSQDGVGIAGPQVGINRRIVAVQRFDKEIVQPDGSITNPFEVYSNIRIIWQSDSLALGPEGCLSVPDRRGDVLRSQEIVIEYADNNAIRNGATRNRATDDIPIVRDTVRGFTAVIFQHEIDHLDGILYIDRI